MILWICVVALVVVAAMLIVLLWLLQQADRIHEAAGACTRPAACPRCGWGEEAGLRAERDGAVTIDGHDAYTIGSERVPRVPVATCRRCAEPLTARKVLDRP